MRLPTGQILSVPFSVTCFTTPGTDTIYCKTPGCMSHCMVCPWLLSFPWGQNFTHDTETTSIKITVNQMLLWQLKHLRMKTTSYSSSQKLCMKTINPPSSNNGCFINVNKGSTNRIHDKKCFLMYQSWFRDTGHTILS